MSLRRRSGNRGGEEGGGKHAKLGRVTQNTGWTRKEEEQGEASRVCWDDDSVRDRQGEGEG